MASGLHLSDLRAALVQHGAKPSHVKRLLRAWMGLCPWEEKKGDPYPKALSDYLPEFRNTLENLARAVTVPSAERDSVKIVSELSDGELIESVLLPRDGICVSSQVGCAVGCLFCMTGKSGLIRQLGSAEILAQIAEGRKYRPQLKRAVFMGMGEPSHNMKAVLEAVTFIGQELEFRYKDIVVSTAGDTRLFHALLSNPVRPALALSLHTTDNALRRRLLPKASPLSAEEVLSAAMDYSDAAKHSLQVEWTLMEGVNDSFSQIERLAELIRCRNVMVNFIAVNAVEGSPFRRPSAGHMQDLITVLRHQGNVATLRESAAQDVEGGCGQLRAKVLKEKKASA